MILHEPVSQQTIGPVTYIWTGTDTICIWVHAAICATVTQAIISLFGLHKGENIACSVLLALHKIALLLILASASGDHQESCLKPNKRTGVQKDTIRMKNFTDVKYSSSE